MNAKISLEHASGYRYLGFKYVLTVIAASTLVSFLFLGDHDVPLRGRVFAAFMVGLASGMSAWHDLWRIAGRRAATRWFVVKYFAFTVLFFLQRWPNWSLLCNLAIVASITTCFFSIAFVHIFHVRDDPRTSSNGLRDTNDDVPDIPP